LALGGFSGNSARNIEAFNTLATIEKVAMILLKLLEPALGLTQSTHVKIQIT